MPTSTSKPMKPSYGTNAVVPSSKLSATADLADFGANPPGCVAARVASQSMVSAAPVTFFFDTEIFDNTQAMFAPTAATITVVGDGLYRFSGWCAISSNSVGQRSLEIFQNGVVVLSESMPATVGFDSRISISNEFLCLTGDVITLIGYQNSGSTLAGLARLSVVRASGS